MIQVYKILNDLYDDSLPTFFTINSERRGHKHKLFQHRPNKDIRKHNFSTRVVGMWNNLPPEAINAKNLIAFERELDRHWKDQELLYNFKAELKY